MIHPPTPYPFLASKVGRDGRVVLLGAPLDRTGSFRPGCEEGPIGIRWASENLETYSPYLDRDLEDYDISDVGDLIFSGMSVAESVLMIEDEVDQIITAGSIPFIMGGEHTIALPIACAVMHHYHDAMILHLDAHADLREEYLDQKLTHATWAYHIGTEFGFDRLVQLGIRSGTRDEFSLGREKSRCFSMDMSIPDDVREELLARPVYISLDIDVLDACVAPGTGTPEAGGPGYREVMDCLYGLAGMNVVAIDINEVSPPLDPTGASSTVASKITRELLLLFGK